MKLLAALLVLATAVTTGLTANAADGLPRHGNRTDRNPAKSTAEIQIFLNYRGSNDYDSKLVSNWDQPVTAEYLYVNHDEQPLNGACFKGNPDEALNLFSHMVEIFNNDTGRSIESWGDVYYDEATRAHALTIYERGEDGITTTWFQRMRECVRWSTPEERENY
jgi:hypothetical protein